jgi:hypothetical protein
MEGPKSFRLRGVGTNPPPPYPPSFPYPPFFFEKNKKKKKKGKGENDGNKTLNRSDLEVLEWRWSGGLWKVLRKNPWICMRR